MLMEENVWNWRKCLELGVAREVNPFVVWTGLKSTTTHNLIHQLTVITQFTPTIAFHEFLGNVLCVIKP